MGAEFNSYTGVVTIDGGSSTNANSGVEFNSFKGFEVPGDIMSTVKSKQGSSVTGRLIEPTDTIEVHGQRMSVAMAASPQMGFLTRDAGGNFVPTAKGHSGAAEVEPAKGTALASGGTMEEGQTNGFRADDQTEEVMTTMTQGLRQDTQIAAVDSVLRNFGEIDVRAAGRIASQLGIEPHQATEMVNTAIAGMEDAAYRHIEPLGVYSRDAFTAFLNSTPQVAQDKIEAFRDLAYHNSTKGLEALAEKFATEADRHDPEGVADALTVSGIPFKPMSSGGYLLDLSAQGLGQMAFKQAVQLGVIKLAKDA